MHSYAMSNNPMLMTKPLSIFGGRKDVFSELFSETLECLLQIRAHLTEAFRYNLVEKQAQLYTSPFSNVCGFISNASRFIDCTKIYMQRFGGPNTN